MLPWYQTAVLQRVLPFAQKVGRPEQDDQRHGSNYVQRVYGVSGKPSSATGDRPEIVAILEQSDHKHAPTRAIYDNVSRMAGATKPCAASGSTENPSSM